MSGNVLSVADLLSGTGEHTAQLCFHCDPLCSVAQEQPNRVVIINDGVTVIMTIPDELSVSLHRGEQRAGWYSPCFGVKIPAYTIFAGVHCTLPVTFTTTIEVQHGS